MCRLHRSSAASRSRRTSPRQKIESHHMLLNWESWKNAQYSVTKIKSINAKVVITLDPCPIDTVVKMRKKMMTLMCRSTHSFRRSAAVSSRGRLELRSLLRNIHVEILTPQRCSAGQETSKTSEYSPLATHESSSQMIDHNPALWLSS